MTVNPGQFPYTRREVVSKKDAKNTIDRSYEQQGRFKKNRYKKDFLYMTCPFRK